MAYVQVEADDRLEEGPEGLQFKSFLGTDTRAGPGTPKPQRSAGVGNADRGYLAEEARPKATGGFWTIEYYQSYFDIDTKTVLKRCYMTMNPLAAATYIPTHLNPADLYGPFWTLNTLIFALFLSSSLAASVSAYLGSSEEYDYDFKLLSIAMSLVYAYGLALPVLLWLALRYLGAISLWGYGQFVWIPVSVLCVIPVALVRWILVGIAFGLSGYFLGANIYPILASAEAKATRLLIILLAVLHLGLALSFKILFFNYYVIENTGPDISIPGIGHDGPAAGGNSTVGARWL
ncbi:Yip1 domain family protein [Ephemerocybe angulata]|uniref:Yip1 domain family protein n=1 Tax=Ephemerocybe angulata TaxID=980116 RepID=A0A8H6HFE3_9AGAR|nr:Yip1 domain family protein [Tulosesus angulatus]